MNCPHCGKEITETAKFCPGCGNALGGAPEPADNASASPAPPRKSNRGLLIGLIIALACILCGAGITAAVLLTRNTGNAKDDTAAVTTQKETEKESGTSADTTTQAPDTTVVPPDTYITPDTTAQVTVPYVGNAETYICTAGGYPYEYSPCLQLYPDGSFVFTENLLSGMGKIYGNYHINGTMITCSVTDTYDSGYAGSGVYTLVFTKRVDGGIQIGQNLCGTYAGNVFFRNDSFVPSEPYVENNMDYSIYPDYYYDMDIAYNVRADGGLNMRTGPGTGYDRIVLIPDGELIFANGESWQTSDWIYATYGGYSGWVNINYLTMFEFGAY